MKETGVLLEKRKFNRKDLPQWVLKAIAENFFLNGADAISLKIAKGKTVFAGTLVRQKYSR